MNVIVVVADSLRFDHLGCNGNDWIQTPHLDAFAEQATRFSRTYSEGLPTLPTRTAFWTGRYTLPFRGWQSVEPDDYLLAEHLWDKGYQTALITDVYHMHKPGMAFPRGFDSVRFVRGQEYDAWQVMDDAAVDADAMHNYRGEPEVDALWRARFIQYLKNVSVRQSEEDYFAPRVVREGIRWLKERAKRDDLFLWLDLFDPHEPWDPPAPYDSLYDADYDGKPLIDPIPGEVEGYLTPQEVAHVAARYAGEISFVDKWVGRFFDAVKDLGLWNNSLIILTTDHGELLGERNCIRKARPWPYEELSHIPMVMRLPDGEGAGQTVDGFVQTCDLFPTIADVLDVPLPSGLHGKSLLPLMRDETLRWRDFAISGFHGQSWSIRNETWSLYLWLEGYQEEAWDPRRAGTRELYRLAEDPQERDDLATQHPAVADALELTLRRFIAGLRWE